MDAEDQIVDLTHQIDKERAALLSETLRLEDIVKGMKAGLDSAHSDRDRWQMEVERLRHALDEGERRHMQEYNQIAKRCDGLTRDLAACREELSRERADSDDKATKTITWVEELRAALAKLRDVSGKTLAYAAVVEQQRDACRDELATAIQQRMDAERQVADLRQKLDLLTAGPKYEHDCARCRFLGSWTDAEQRTFDLYFCAKLPTVPTVIARFGNEGWAYTSGIGFKVAPLVEAERRAIERGLLPDSRKK